MALTVRIVDRNKVGNWFEHTVEVTGDSSQASGGEALTAATLGFDDHATEIFVFPFPKAGYVPVYDNANAKLIVYWVDTTVDGAAMADAAGANLSAVTFLVLARGKRPTAVTQGA
jgi:hypothetical protein